MKIYKFERPTIVRVDVFVKGQCKTFSVAESDAQKVKEELEYFLSLKKIEQDINPLDKPKKIRIQCYEHTGKSKGRCYSFTVYGLSVDEAYSVLMKNIDE